MKKTMQAAMMMIATSSASAFAAAGTQPEETMGMAAYLFLGFLALVIVGQLVPAIGLLVGILRGAFSKQPEEMENS